MVEGEGSGEGSGEVEGEGEAEGSGAVEPEGVGAGVAALSLMLTYTLQLCDTPPGRVAVIVTEPLLTAETVPFWSTVATLSLEEVHVIEPLEFAGINLTLIVTG